MELAMNKINDREVPTSISDSAKVRSGALSPAFPPLRRSPASAGDASKVRIGALSPAFPPGRAN
jgi:hypothetical protein